METKFIPKWNFINLLKMYKSEGGGRQTNRRQSRQTGKEGKGGEIIEEKFTNSRVKKSR